ncbi:MAG: DciA family protein [Candidatus Omnitrophica bacterium]|nr:DciA family protein [Candidatus Omnitrophota bacterium]
MERIKDTIKSLMQDLASKQDANLKDNPEVLLKKYLSRKEQKHVKVQYFRKGTLGIAVDSSTWLYYLNLQKDRLLADFNKESSLIKDIRFKLA